MLAKYFPAKKPGKLCWIFLHLFGNQTGLTQQRSQANCVGFSSISLATKQTLHSKVGGSSTAQPFPQKRPSDQLLLTGVQIPAAPFSSFLISLKPMSGRESILFLMCLDTLSVLRYFLLMRFHCRC